MERHPFSELVDPSPSVRAEFPPDFFTTLRPRGDGRTAPEYGKSHGFEDTTPSNVEMAAWTIFEYR